MSKHTPGPWIVGQPEDHPYMVQKMDDEEYWFHSIADCEVGENMTEEEGKANARLIAAAPELLEALEDCLKFLEQENKRYYRDGEWSEVTKAKSAIAKAKGN